jgi:hypothetical protein
MFQNVFLDWELPRTLSFISYEAWVKTDQEILHYNVGYLLFRKFSSGHIVHNRINTVLSFF